jgi:hypothetical protein
MQLVSETSSVADEGLCDEKSLQAAVKFTSAPVILTDERSRTVSLSEASSLYLAEHDGLPSETVSGIDLAKSFAGCDLDPADET